MNAILLAGGESSRYGSNKAFIEINNQLMVEKILKKLNLHFDKVYLVVQNKEDYDFLYNTVIVEDIIPGMGPLGGLYTGLKLSDSNKNYLSACDMPFLVDDYINYLKNYSEDYDILVAQKNSYVEPFAAIYKKSALNAVKFSIEKGNLKITDFYDYVNVKSRMILSY